MRHSLFQGERAFRKVVVVSVGPEIHSWIVLLPCRPCGPDDHCHSTSLRQSGRGPPRTSPKSVTSKRAVNTGRVRHPGAAFLKNWSELPYRSIYLIWLVFPFLVKRLRWRDREISNLRPEHLDKVRMEIPDPSRRQNPAERNCRNGTHHKEFSCDLSSTWIPERDASIISVRNFFVLPGTGQFPSRHRNEGRISWREIVRGCQPAA